MSLGSTEGERLRARRLLKFTAALLVVATILATVYFSLMLPIFVSAFLAYLLLPLVDRLERKRVPRSVAIPVIVVGALAILGFAAVRITPVVYRQAMSLVLLIPSAFSTVMETWLPLAERYVAGLGFVSAEDLHRYVSGVNLMTRLETQLQAGLVGLWTTGTRLVGGIFNLILIPLLTFFLLKDYRRLVASLRKLVPRDLLAPIRDLRRRLDHTLRTLIKGQVTVAGILALMYVIGLSIVGLRSAIVIGIVAGICRVIPYLDVIVGATLSTVVLLSDFHGWGQAMGVMIVFLVVQAIDGAFVTPAILGEKIGLHPMVVIASVLAFANWWGFWGVLLAVPVVAVMKVLLETAAPYYFGSRSYDPEV